MQKAHALTLLLAILPTGAPVTVIAQENPALAALATASERESDWDGKFAADPVDPDWAPTMEEEIYNVLSPRMSTLSIAEMDIECRTWLCRINLTHQSTEFSDHAVPLIQVVAPLLEEDSTRLRGATYSTIIPLSLPEWQREAVVREHGERVFTTMYLFGREAVEEPRAE